MSPFQSFLRSLLTKHLLAKFFAVFFACVTVALIDADIGSETDWEEKRIPIFFVRGDSKVSEKGLRILLTADPRVWIDVKSEGCKVKISGPKNQQAKFMANPVIKVHVREEQVPALQAGGGPPTIFLDASNYEPEIEGVKVLFLEKFEVGVDFIKVEENVRLKLGNVEGVRSNRIVDSDNTRIIPSVASVVGPRHAFRVSDPGTPLTLTVVPTQKTGLIDGKSYDLEVTDGFGVVSFITGNPIPKVKLSLKRPEPSRVDLGNMEIFWALTEDVRRQMIRGQVTMVEEVGFEKARVKISAPPKVMASFQDLDALRKSIRIIADPNRQIGEILVGNKDVKIPLIALGVPRGLIVEMEPDTVSLKISRKNTENK
ncbi:MAG: hypothetical protein ACI97A_003564 [Planctomycetota bacterium]|jgi:hypothetical protein